MAAFATPELTAIACGCALSRWAFETTTGAAWTWLTVNMAVPTAGVSERTSARSLAFRRIPAWIPEARNPFGAVTLMGHPVAHEL